MKTPKRILQLVVAILGITWWTSEGVVATPILKIGRANPDTARSGHEDSLSAFWPVNVIPTFPDTAESLFISVTHSLDFTLDSINVTGLGANWQKQSITLDPPFVGDVNVTKVGTSTWRRVNSVSIRGDSTNYGDVYILASRSVAAGVPTNNAHIRALVPARVGRDAQLIYTVPENKEARIVRTIVTPSFSTASSSATLDSATADVLLKVREYGQDWQTWDVRRTTGLTHRIPSVEFEYGVVFPDLPARTDVMYALAVTASATWIDFRGSMLLDERP